MKYLLPTRIEYLCDQSLHSSSNLQCFSCDSFLASNSEINICQYIFNNSFAVGTMEMARQVRYILCKHEGMGSIPRTHFKKPDVADVAASACKHRLISEAHSPTSLAE